MSLYDTMGSMKELFTTRNGEVLDTTRWSRDFATGLVTNKIYADSSEISYTYTTDGKPLRTTWARGNWKENTYDSLGRLGSTSSSDGLYSDFDYDIFSRISSASNAVASYAYARTSLGLVTNESIRVAESSSSLIRTLDDYSRISKLDLSGAPPTTAHYAFDTDGHLAVVSNGAFSVSYAFSNRGFDSGHTLTLSNGVTHVRTLSRNGWRHELIRQVKNTISTGYTNTLVYTYDDAGRRTARNSDTFGYNARSKVTSATISNTVASYAYDYMSRRVMKVTPEATHTFVYDGWNLIQETVATVWGVTTNTYVWGKDLSGTMQGAGGVGGLLAVSLDGDWHFPFYDANGNITAYVNESGVIVADYTYDAFGNTITQFGSMPDVFRFRFSTKYYDTETGLYYYGLRFYSPDLHRWLNRDPIEEKGGRNLYTFCENNGVNRCDVLGKKSNADPNNNIQTQTIKVPIVFKVLFFKSSQGGFFSSLFSRSTSWDGSKNLNGGLMTVDSGSVTMRVAMYPAIGFPPSLIPRNYTSEISAPIATGSIAARHTGSPQPNRTGISSEELFGEPTEIYNVGGDSIRASVKEYTYGNANFDIFRTILVNGDPVNPPRTKMFRTWLYPPAQAIQGDMFEDVQVNLCDEIDVKMGNGDSLSGSPEFWTKYKILRKK